MKPSIDYLVKTEGNTEAFEAIINMTQPRDEPLNLYIWGQVGSGKTTGVQARAFEKDLLSTKRALLHSPAEMLSVLRFGASDDYFDRIGKVDVLFVDDFEGFYSDPEVGSMFCKLMLEERMSHGLETVFTGSRPLEEQDLRSFGNIMEGFKQIEIKPLAREDYPEYAQKFIQSLKLDDTYPLINQDALSYVSLEFAKDLEEIETALTYLLKGADFDKGQLVTAEMAKEALRL